MAEKVTIPKEFVNAKLMIDEPISFIWLNPFYVVGETLHTQLQYEKNGIPIT